MKNKPKWAMAKVRLHLATCYMGHDEELDMPTLQGINWFNDRMLLPFSVFFHNYFVQPFHPEITAFKIKVIEEYEDISRLVL